jgi:hypothetical protein
VSAERKSKKKKREKVENLLMIFAATHKKAVQKKSERNISSD